MSWGFGNDGNGKGPFDPVSWGSSGGSGNFFEPVSSGSWGGSSNAFEPVSWGGSSHDSGHFSSGLAHSTERQINWGDPRFVQPFGKPDDYRDGAWGYSPSSPSTASNSGLFGNSWAPSKGLWDPIQRPARVTPEQHAPPPLPQIPSTYTTYAPQSNGLSRPGNQFGIGNSSGSNSGSGYNQPSYAPQSSYGPQAGYSPSSNAFGKKG